MQENASSTCEINDLRREANLLRLERQEARVQGTARSGSQTNKKSRNGSDACSDPRKPAETQTLLESHKQQICTLTAQVEDLQNRLQKGSQTARRSPPPHRASRLEKTPVSYSNRTLGSSKPDSVPGSPTRSRSRSDNKKDSPTGVSERRRISGAKNAGGEHATSWQSRQDGLPLPLTCPNESLLMRSRTPLHHREYLFFSGTQRSRGGFHDWRKFRRFRAKAGPGPAGNNQRGTQMKQLNTVLCAGLRGDARHDKR